VWITCIAFLPKTHTVVELCSKSDGARRVWITCIAFLPKTHTVVELCSKSASLFFTKRTQWLRCVPNRNVLEWHQLTSPLKIYRRGGGPSKRGWKGYNTTLWLLHIMFPPPLPTMSRSWCVTSIGLELTTLTLISLLERYHLTSHSKTRRYWEGR
jgi:hypothetical protein